MKKEIIINSTLNEERIAITEDGKLAELFIELPDKERSIGNIYLGKVTRIVQGINAAFIDIGLKQDAFLHFSDIDQSMENIITDEEDENQIVSKRQKKKKKGQKDKEESSDKIDSTSVALRKQSSANKDNNSNKAVFKTKKLGKFHINIEPKQNIIVQIVREAYSSKGVKVTTKIGIPGRYTVLMPFENSIGISRKINSIHERKRLRQLARTVLPMDYGCIIRTAALNKNDTELLNDWKSLLEVWKEIEEEVKKMDSPGLLYQDLKIATSVIRDLFTPEVKRVVVDSKKLHKEIITYLKSFSPHLVNKVDLYNEKIPIFDKFGIEKELESTSKRKVYLPSGGSIVIDQTEAMVVVDVNSGKSITTGEDQHEQNAFLTNMEAIREIARQIRLRDIGGMVLIDMIDVKRQKNKKKLLDEMRKELSKDRAKTMVYPLTQLSIMQITRQRINQNIGEKISEECPMCQGSGRVTSKGVVSNALERWLKNFRIHSREFRLILHVHPHLATYLTEGTISRLSRLMIKYFVKIKVQQSDVLKMDDFRFYSVRQQKDITQDYI